MYTRSPEKVARWQNIVSDIRKKLLDPLADRAAIEEALGTEHEEYVSWSLEKAEIEQREYFSLASPADFRKMLLSVNYNDRHSIHAFEDFLLKPNITPITIGKLNGVLLKLSAGMYILEPHELEFEELLQINDGRLGMPQSILGLWSSKSIYRAGQYSDEGYSSGEPTQRVPMPEAALEVFQQLGLLLASRPTTAKENLESKECRKTNYALVRNVYDDSIWVLWRKFILYPGTADYGLAKDLWSEEYAVFPGMEGESAIFAKLADDWDQLGPGTDLRLSRIFRAPSSRNQVEEPLLVCAVRTAEGGIRRENDFRAMGPREL